MASDAVQRRLELLQLCHHPSLEAERVLERARAYEAWLTGESPSMSALKQADELLAGKPSGPV